MSGVVAMVCKKKVKSNETGPISSSLSRFLSILLQFWAAAASLEQFKVIILDAIIFKIELSNYGTKSDLKNATGVGFSKKSSRSIYRFLKSRKTISLVTVLWTK